MSDENNVRLTVAIIARNAASELRETLGSIRSIADEIIVIDTGSSDHTREIAIHGGAQLVDHPWQDSFADARNAAAPFVMGDWVLWLDAGETMSQEDARGLRKFLNESAEPTSAYAMLVQIPPMGISIALEQIARLRLIPDVQGIEFTGRVRETVLPSLAAAGIRIDGLPFRIQRGMREHDPQLKVRKAKRNIQLADLQIAQSGPSAPMLNCLGEAFQNLKEDLRATQQFRLALECSERGSADMLEAYYGLLTSLDSDPKNRESQLSICLEALEIFPLDAQLLCAMGNYLHATNRFDLAVRSFDASFRFGKVHPQVWHLEEIREIAAGCWSIGLQIQQQNDAAIAALQTALDEFPHSVRLRRQMIELQAKMGHRTEALAHFDQLPREVPQRAVLKGAVRGAALAGVGNWISAKAYLQTAYEKGCRDPLCLKWLTMAYLSFGETGEATKICKEWKQLDPHNAEIDMYLRSTSTPTKPNGLRVDAASTAPSTSHMSTAQTSGHKSTKQRSR